jgi:hypothetical protein
MREKGKADQLYADWIRSDVFFLVFGGLVQ